MVPAAVPATVLTAVPVAVPTAVPAASTHLADHTVDLAQPRKLCHLMISSKTKQAREISLVYLNQQKKKKAIMHEINRKIEANVSNINQDNSKDESYTVGPLLHELVKQQALNSLPKQQPPVFTGNYFDYPYFITAFESLIESRVEDPQQRLYYLGQFMNGEAREVIKGLVTLNSPEAYAKARSLLKERFGHPYRVAHAYKEKLMNWTAIKDAGEGTLLLKFSDFLMQAEEAMKTLQYMDVLNNEDMIKKICSKLPNFPIKGETVKFHDFVEFVKAEAAFSTNPVFSPCAIKEKSKVERRTEVKEQGSRKWKRGNFTSSFSTNVGNPSDIHKCILCSKYHSLDSCQKFQGMKLKERIDFIRKKELCFGCLRVGHVSKRCLTRKNCDICQLKHPTLLHDPTKSGSMKECSTQTSTNSDQTSTPNDSTINNCLNVCNAVKSSDKVDEIRTSSMYCTSMVIP